MAECPGEFLRYLKARNVLWGNTS